MVRRLLCAVLMSALLLAFQTANAALFSFNTVLTGAAEIPAAATPGTGFASLLFDDVTNVLTIDVTFSGLLGDAALAHIHCCTTVPGSANVGVATELPSFENLPFGEKSGTFQEILDLGNADSFNPAFVTARGSLDAARSALLAGLTTGNAYLNIHTTLFPGGEIRGLITAVPEPGTLSLAPVVLLGLLALRRRRTAH